MYQRLMLIFAIITSLTVYSCNKESDPLDPVPTIGDQDKDGINDDEDNCVLISNADQTDLDQDGIGDDCDEDMDGDGIDNTMDNCPMLANPDQIDEDQDGIGDDCDPSVDLSVDLTTLIIGDYLGTNKFGEDGSFITEEGRTAKVTMVSDSVVNLLVNTGFGDNLNFDAKLSTETLFSASNVSIFGDGTYGGTGWLSGDSLYIDLSTGNKVYEFGGLRQ